MLPSEKELTGKEELNAFTFISDNFLELFAYKGTRSAPRNGYLDRKA